MIIILILNLEHRGPELQEPRNGRRIRGQVAAQ
jgi:hypothetical protein